MEKTSDRHVVTPLTGTIRDKSGNPCAGLKPDEYPTSAMCAVCGRPCKLAKPYSPEWEHSEG